MQSNKTAENAKRFLSNDFQRHRQKARLSTVLPGAVTWDSQPGGSTYGNSQENKLVNYTYSKTLTESVYATFDVMSNKDTSRHKAILKMCFMDELDDIIVIQRLNMSDRSFYYNKRTALLEFAELFQEIIDFSA
ncbi:ArpU family phage packaging/lysis transcriptional regulator [Weissella tructae]